MIKAMSRSEKNIYADLEYLGGADGFVEDILEVIESIKLFDDFGVDEIRVLCHYMDCYAAPRDYILLEEGADGDFLLLVLNGSVSVKKKISDQESTTIADVGIGDLLGEMSLIDGRPRYATCSCDLPTDFAVLTRGGLNEILVHHPRLGNKFLLTLLHLICVRLRDTCDRALPVARGGTV